MTKDGRLQLTSLGFASKVEVVIPEVVSAEEDRVLLSAFMPFSRSHSVRLPVLQPQTVATVAAAILTDASRRLPRQSPCISPAENGRESFLFFSACVHP